ncbi:MAG: hypothetical protein AABX37_03425 [Nanoarchaeota archaeon]
MITMNTKGITILMMIFTILGVVVILSVIFSVAYGLGRSETTIKVNTVEDMVMMVHALIGMPGNALVYYPGDLSAYSLVVHAAQNITLYKQDEPATRWVSRSVFLPEGYTLSGSLVNVQTVCVEKVGKDINIKRCEHG